MSRDTFTRSTSYGLGTGWTWSNFDSSFSTDPTASPWHVDGEKVVIPADPTQGDIYDSYSFDAGTPTTGTVQFDIFLPVLSEYNGSVDLWPRVYFFANGGGKSYELLVDQITSGGTPQMEIGGTGIAFSTVNIDPGNWYTAKLSYRSSDNLCRWKLWKRGTLEPGWLASGTGTRPSGFANIIDFYLAGTVESYLDNFQTESEFNLGGFTADAVIIEHVGSFTADAHVFSPVVNGSVTANATLKKTTSASFTADASIPGALTANAVLLKTRLFANLTVNAVVALRRFTVDSTITDIRRNRHLRRNDHTGLMRLSDFVLDAPIVARYPGLPTYPAGTSLTYVLGDIYARLLATGKFRFFTANAVILRTQGSYYRYDDVGNAFFIPGSSRAIPVAAVVYGVTTESSITADAVVA